MIEINKKRIINLLTIVVLLLSYSGIWAQNCTSMPEPVTYTRVTTGGDPNKYVEEYAYVNGIKVTRILQAGTRSFDKIKYSNEDTNTPTENYCGINRRSKYIGKKYPFMDSDKVTNIIYTFSEPVVDVEVFLAAFGYSGTTTRVEDQIDDVIFSVNRGSLSLHNRADCNSGTIQIVNGNEVKSLKRKTTNAKIGITSTAPFTQLTLTYNEPGGGVIGGAGFYVEICTQSIKPHNSSACNPGNINNNFTKAISATKTLNGVEVERILDANQFADLHSQSYCGSSVTYPNNLPYMGDTGAKKLTYKFKAPVTSAEIFLFAFGESTKATQPWRYDQVRFSINGEGTMSLSQTYNCIPTGTTVNSSTGEVKSADDKLITTDVGIKVSSNKPFTEIVLDDQTPGGNNSGIGYVVEICASSITKANVNNFIVLDAGINNLANQTICVSKTAPVYKAKASAGAFANTATFDYELQAKKGAGAWTKIEEFKDVAPGTEKTFTGVALKSNTYNGASIRVKYTYKNSLFSSVTGVAYSSEATLTVKEVASITSLTASPTSLNETGATNITYTIKGTPGATVTYNINGGTPETLVLDPVTGVKTVDRSGETAKTTLTITKVAKTGLCDLDNIAYKAEVDALGNSCTTHPSVQFAQTSPATATMNGIQVTRTIAGPQSYFQSYTYTTGDMCQPTIMQGYPSMNAGQVSIKYTFDKPITSAEVWLSGFGGAPAPARADRVTFTLNCSGTEVFAASGCGSVTNTQFIATGNEVTHEANVYTQARVKVSSSVPFTELTLNDPGSTSGGYTVELCPGSIKPAKIKVTENPAELTACKGATGKYFTAKAKIDGVSGTEDMSYKWQQSRTNTPGSWVDAVATSPNGSIKADGSTQARLILNTIQESDNGLYYRAEFSFTKCGKTLDKVYSEPAKLNVPSDSDIITIQAARPNDVTINDCTGTTPITAKAKIASGYTIKNSGGNLFGYFLEFKDTDNTWKTFNGQQYSNNANEQERTLNIAHSAAPKGATAFRLRYRVTLTTGCEYELINEFTFTKNLPAEPAINATQTFCQEAGKTVGDLTTLTGIKWYSAATGGSEVVASTTIPVGTNEYFAVATANGCESTRKKITVKVVAKPTTPTVQNKTECPATGNYDMANLVTVLPGHTLKWYNAATGNATTVSTVDRNKTAKTTYEKWVALVTSQGCESDRVKVTYTVDITTQPTITAPANNLSINCADSATAIDAAVNAWMATATATIGCGTATVTNNYATVKPTNLCSVNEFEVTFTVRDAFGNQKTKKKKITIDRLIANDDTESVARSTGKDIDVLSNDTVNGAQATTSNAKVTLVSDGGIGATVTSDGKIRIPGGSVAPGTYNVTYKLCDKNNTSRCGATATVAVTVNNSTIEANHDTPVALTYSASAAYAKAADHTDFNVLSNDKLSGVTPTLSQVDILPTNQTGVTIETSTGKIKVDGATAAGVYNLTYKIKEKNTTNTSATAKVTVVVKNALVVNPATLTAPITPSTSATTPKKIGNVLNQTQLNGNKPNASQVSISVTQEATPPQSGDPVPSIDPATGKVLIPSGVKPGNYTIKYKVCDKAEGIAKSCSDEKTITVNVAGGNTTTTNNDDFTANPVERSNSEEVVKNGANPVNVLANDKLGTRTNIDTDVVTIRQTATSNSGVNIDTATGQIKVAANTPAGVHEVKYKITEKGQTTESTEATAKVVVKNKVALDPAAIPGTVNTPNDGNDKTIANILDKTKINGNKPDAADVVITVPNPAHKNNPSDIVPYVDTTTGKVIVPVGTKPGTHQITYQVCDKLPAGQSAAQTCKTATITIPVTANTATSSNDDYASNPVEVSNSATSYVKNGTEDVNVLSNDALGGNTTINTNLVDITQTHTSHSGVNIETATGKVKVAPNTPAGEYTVKYTIAEKGGGPSSTESTVKVVVKNKVVVNPATIPSSVTPATDGTDKEIGDVLDQTEINGSKPSAAQVTITETSPAPKNDPSDKVPYIDTTTGKVKIPAGVKPGNYPITYQICDKATPASANTCKTATITVKVAGNHLDPKNDDFSQKKVERSTSDAYVKDGANDLNVLSNDKLGTREGLDTNVVTIEQTYTSNNGVTIEVATGKVKVAANTPAGEYTVKYKITEKGQTTASNEVSVKVTVTNKLEVGTITIPNAKPSTDSTTPVSVGNILAQTKINGQLNPDPSEVEITATPDQPGSPKKPYIDTTTGKVMIPAGVAPGDHTISYKVCDKAPGAAKRCEEATVTVKVVSNTPTSEDDDFTADTYKVEHPTVDTFVSDGANPVNVLSNDKLGSDTTISTNEVEITQTATSNSNVNIDTATGKIKVKANTPAGVYTVKYKFTEKGQPASAASAEKTATVVVTNKLTSSNGNYGGAPSTNSTPANGGDVLNNVRINGAKPTPSQVTITVDNNAGSGTVPFLVTSGADAGKIKIPQGTPVGNYTITYTVCDTASGAAKSCKPATANIRVSANAIIATNDEDNKEVEFATSAQNVKKSDNTTLNVLNNDTLAGNTATDNDVTIETTVPVTGITIKTNGEVEVAANKPAGVYELKYVIKETADINNVSDEATVKVVVKNKVTFDPFPATPVKPSTDKNIPATPIDVIANTKINGSTPSANDVTIQVTDPADPQSPGDVVPELNTTTGKVEIPAGVKPGAYNITYRVCDKAQPAEAKTCQENTITINVTGNTITGADDDFSAHKVERSTSDKFVNDGTNDVNVLTNDTLGSRTGLTTELVTINQTHTSDPKVSIDTATGKVKVAADAPAGTHTIKYTITEKGQTTPSAEKTVTVVVTNKITLTPADVVSNPVTPSTDKNTPKEIGDVLDGTKLNGTKPGIGTGANQVTISVVTPAQPQSPGDAVPELDTTTGKVKIPAGVKPGTYNITYKVCDNANPPTCETSTVPITVQGNTTTSADDDFTAHKVVHPTTDTFVSDNGTPVNVLSNDKLGDDDTITTDEVEIIQTATTNPKVSIDTATGKVKVEANTPVGEYTVKYKFKEKGQSDTEASQEKTVTVVVTNQVEIDRANNNYTGAPSINATPAEGGDVLDKVKINGNKPNANEVNITVDTPATGTTVPYLETSGADAGKIKIPQGTPAGTYTITYTVCDKAQPVSARTCEQATATITVDANPIVANADNDNKVVEFSTAAQTVKKTDGTTLNVLANDKLGATTGLNNTLVTIETTQPVTDITIKANGEVEVGANKAPGVYELKYKIKETADPTHVSAEATVKVVVKNKVELDAIPTTPANPSTDGTTPNTVVDILDNTKINGNKPNANEVTIEVVTPATPQSPGDSVPTIDTTTGKVVVPSGVKPGTYTITYKVCDKAQPDEAKTCKTDTVTITVTGNTIQATADDFTAHKVERSNNDASVKNGANEVNVLTNDELGTRTGIDTQVVTITQTATTDPKVTIDTATGKVKVAANTPAGEYTVKYKITEKGQTTASNEVEVKVVVTNKVESEDATYTGTTPTDSNPTTAGNILDHVHFNGGSQAPDPSEVTVEIVTPAPGTTVPTIITTGADTGKIQIPQGTPAGTYPITYKVCDKATGAANTCKTHTATVTVNPATTDIVAQPDTYTLQWDAAERTAEGNILVNDRHLTRENLDTTLVDIQQVAASTPDKVSIDTATGKVKIAAGTPAGTHTISYTITPKGETSPVSAPALVTVVIKNKVELATNPINGAPSSDDTPREIGNVIDNVKINGQRPDPSDVTIEITPATPLEPGRPTPEVDPATGKVTVPKNTPSGEYTIGVKVCDKVTPKTCVNQNITIKVRPDQDLMAEEDEFSVGIMGGTTPSVLRNDKLRGRTVTIADVTVQAIGQARAHTPGLPEPASDRIIIASDGRIDVKDGLQEGDYIYEYSIISKEDTNLISNTKVIIHVAKNVAAEDEIEVEKPREGEADTTSTKSLLDNDAINGQKPIIGTTPGTVTIEKISVTPSAQDKIDIDTTTGKIIVKPGAPIGEYEVEYQICLNGRTSTCKTGKAKVKIQPQLTLAEDNFADRTIVTNNSTNQVGNVLANDTLDGQPIAASEVSIKVTNNAGIPGVTIDAEGNLTIPQGAPSGTHTIEYEVISNTYGVRKTGRVVVNLSNDADLEFYNAISTDEGSQNNGFIIKNIELYPKNNLKIFNRYGVLIFEKDGYTNASPFKGISEGRATVNKDGKLPQGTYYYILEYTDGKNQTQQKTGWLYIK
nr:gliding motility-associated C-terminal domain-containing protein [uncultured Capnocytophaga sp.]